MQQMIDVQREIQSQQLNTVRLLQYRELMKVDTNESYRFFFYLAWEKKVESLVVLSSGLSLPFSANRIKCTVKYHGLS